MFSDCFIVDSNHNPVWPIIGSLRFIGCQPDARINAVISSHRMPELHSRPGQAAGHQLVTSFPLSQLPQNEECKGLFLPQFWPRV